MLNPKTSADIMKFVLAMIPLDSINYINFIYAFQVFER